MNLVDRLAAALNAEGLLADYLVDLIIEAKAEIERLQKRKFIAELSTFADAANKFPLPDDFSVKVWAEGEDLDAISVASLKALLSRTVEELYVPRSEMQRAETRSTLTRLYSVVDHIHGLTDRIEKAIAKGRGVKL